MRARAVTPLGLCRMMLEVLPECRLNVVYDDGSVIEKIGRCKMTSTFYLCYKGCKNDPLTRVPYLEMTWILKDQAYKCHRVMSWIE